MSETAPSKPNLFFPFMAGFYDRASGLAYPLIRLFTGLFLMPHGAQKLFGWFGGRGLEATAQGFAERLGLEPGMFFAVLAGGTEFFGGLCLAIGLFTRVAAAGVVGAAGAAAARATRPSRNSKTSANMPSLMRTMTPARPRKKVSRRNRMARKPLPKAATPMAIRAAGGAVAAGVAVARGKRVADYLTMATDGGWSCDKVT